MILILNPFRYWEGVSSDKKLLLEASHWRAVWEQSAPLEYRYSLSLGQAIPHHAQPRELPDQRVRVGWVEFDMVYHY